MALNVAQVVGQIKANVGKTLHAESILKVFRCHQKQIVDFTAHRPNTAGRKSSKGMPRSHWLKRLASLGKGDQRVQYIKPTTKPTGMSEEDFASLRETMILRESQYTIAEPGRRTRVIPLVTTLLDPVL